MLTNICDVNITSQEPGVAAVATAAALPAAVILMHDVYTCMVRPGTAATVIGMKVA